MIGNLVEHLDWQPGQGCHPLVQRLGEVDLAAHRRSGDRGHRLTGTGPLGQHLNDFTLNQSGVDIEDDEPLGPTLEAVILHSDVDALLGTDTGQVDPQSALRAGRY